MIRWFIVFSLLCSSSALAQSSAPAYLNSKLPAAVRAHDLVAQMTLDEKASQLEDWAPAIPRLGIPDYQTWNEGLHGVANSGYATVFPQAIGIAATWDTSLARQIGEVIATEARAKYNQAQREGNHRIFYGLTFWSPNVNIFRDPRWGRGQETYGEDPFLTSRMGVAFIRGMQGDDPDHPEVVATSKHYAVHSGPDATRDSANVNVSARDLEETYLPAFRSTVIDGHVKSVMCAYNAIDGTAACANAMLLQDHLRDAWKFKGFIVSDCSAIADIANSHHEAPDIMHASVLAIKAGTDLSCSVWQPGFNTLAEAVRKGLLSEDDLTRSVERLYTARFQLGMFDAPGSGPYDSVAPSEIASEEHRALSLKAARESIVLLTNDGFLPLANPKKIAVIGPTADLLDALEGNYHGEALAPVSPLDGIEKQFPNATVRYAQGATLAQGVLVPVPRTVFPGGLRTEFFATPDWTGKPVAVGTDPEVQHDWRDAEPVPQLQTHSYSVRWVGQMRVPAAGKYVFVLEPADHFPYSPQESYRLMLDGRVLSEGTLTKGRHAGQSSHAAGSSPSAPPVMSDSVPARIEVNLLDTKEHAFELDYSHSGDRAGGGLTLDWAPPARTQLAEAVRAAKASDVVVAFVGLSPQLEGEGKDRTGIDLPSTQRDMIAAVAATGKPVVVVSLSGSALALTWAKEHAVALMQAWYPGGQGGTAIAETLAGASNPAGRLPITFYGSTNDLPPYTDYSMKDRTYRYYTGKPLWGFGFGLSYSTFSFGALHVRPSTAAGLPVIATVVVTNTALRGGDEVVEAYLKTPQPAGPRYSLVGFKRIHLNPGQRQEVEIKVDPRSLSSVDEQGNRAILPGTYRLTVGGSQPGEGLPTTEATFQIQGEVQLP